MKRFDQVFPPTLDEPPDPLIHASQGTSSVVIAAFTMVTLAMGYMLYREKGAWAAVALGLPFFLITVALYLLVVTQTFSKVFADWQRELTKRRYIDALGRYVETRHDAQWTLTGDTLPHADNFVPALPIRAKDGAVAWLRRLYHAKGTLSPRYVLLDTQKPDYYGMIRCKMCDEEEREWLLGAGVLREVSGGYCIDVDRYYYVDSIERL